MGDVGHGWSCTGVRAGGTRELSVLLGTLNSSVGEICLTTATASKLKLRKQLWILFMHPIKCLFYIPSRSPLQRLCLGSSWWTARRTPHGAGGSAVQKTGAWWVGIFPGGFIAMEALISSSYFVLLITCCASVVGTKDSAFDELTPWVASAAVGLFLHWAWLWSNWLWSCLRILRPGDQKSSVPALILCLFPGEGAGGAVCTGHINMMTLSDYTDLSGSLHTRVSPGRLSVTLLKPSLRP